MRQAEKSRYLARDKFCSKKALYKQKDKIILTEIAFPGNANNSYLFSFASGNAREYLERCLEMMSISSFNP